MAQAPPRQANGPLLEIRSLAPVQSHVESEFASRAWCGAMKWRTVHAHDNYRVPSLMKSTAYTNQ
eukprot:6486024-Prymnesium_polylepis.2